MHGLVNRSIQVFVSEVYGPTTWSRVAAQSPTGCSEFNALRIYDDVVSEHLLRAVCDVLDKSRDSVLEDLGTWLVTGKSLPVRRLLRFGGTDFVEFLHSLDDLPGRARLAVRTLELPSLELREHAPFTYSLTIGPQMPGFGHVLLGMLRAMADDYGALALMDHAGGHGMPDVVSIRLVQADYAQGKAFDLAGRP